MSAVFRTAGSRPMAAFRMLTVAFLFGLLSAGPATAGETQEAAAESQAVYEVGVDGLACPFCAYGVEKQLGKIDGVDSVETGIKAGLVVITMEPGATLDEDDARRAVEAAGFTMRSFSEKDGEA